MSKIQRDRISPEVRERVMKVAEELGYRPNRHAQVMRGVRSNCIGILSFNAMHLLVQRKLKAATEAILGHGYKWIVEETLWYNALGERAISCAIESLIDARVEGVILNYPSRKFTQEMLNQFLNAGIPVVVIGGGPQQLKGVPSFISDRRWGYEMITRHLLEGGCRRLTLLAVNTPYCYDGFHDALVDFPEAAALAEVVRPVVSPSLAAQFAMEERLFLPGEVGMKEVFRRGELPDAVVCANDEWAMGALSCCFRAGVRVPENLALTGADNDPAGRFGAVPITTIEHPVQEISHQAVHRLVTMIRQDEKPKDELICIRGRLLVRRSCGLAGSMADLTLS